MPGRKLVVIVSPLKPNGTRTMEDNLKYLGAAVKDSIRRGEVPFAGHGFYTHCLDDTIPAERTLGMVCGREWGAQADLAVAYVDHGISDGMRQDIEFYEALGLVVHYRQVAESSGAVRGPPA